METPISDQALAFLRCTILLRPSLPRTFNMLSEIERKSKSMEDKNAGDEAMRWAERHISNHSNCEASRSPKHSMSLKVTLRRTSRYWQFAGHGCQVLNFCFLLMSQRWLCQLQLSTTGVQNVHREWTRKFWSSTVTKTTRWKDSYSSDGAGCVAGFNESFHETSCSDQSHASTDDHMFNGDCVGDSNWRGFHVKELCQHSTGVLVASSQPNALVREGNL